MRLTSEISAYSNELCGTTPAGATSLTVTKGGNGSGTVTSSPGQLMWFRLLRDVPERRFRHPDRHPGCGFDLYGLERRL